MAFLESVVELENGKCEFVVPSIEDVLALISYIHR
jgi:hypothetical protein